MQRSAKKYVTHFVRRFLIMRAYGISLSKRFETTEKLYTLKIFLKMADERMHIAYPLCYPPGSAQGHKLQKPSTKSGIFRSLGTISFVLFY